MCNVITIKYNFSDFCAKKQPANLWRASPNLCRKNFNDK